MTTHFTIGPAWTIILLAILCLFAFAVVIAPFLKKRPECLPPADPENFTTGQPRVQSGGHESPDAAWVRPGPGVIPRSSQKRGHNLSGMKADKTVEQLGCGVNQPTDGTAAQAGTIAARVSQGSASSPARLTAEEHNKFRRGRWS